MNVNSFLRQYVDSILALLSKDYRARNGIVHERDVIDDDNEFFVQVMLTIKKSFLFRMIYFGEFYLVQLFLNSLGLTENKKIDLSKNIFTQRRNFAVIDMPLKDLNENVRKINELLKLIDAQYTQDHFYDLILLRQQYDYVATQYLVERRAINFVYRNQITPVFHMIDQSELSLPARNALSDLLEKIRVNQEYCDSHQDMGLALAKKDIEIEQDAQLMFQAEEFVKIYGAEVSPEHIVQIRTCIDERKAALDKNDKIFQSILKHLSAQIKEADNADKKDTHEKLTNIVDMLEQLSKEQRDKIKQPLYSLKQTLLSFKDAPFDERNILLKKCAGELKEIMKFQPGLLELRIIHDKIEARLILADPVKQPPILDHTLVDQMIGQFRASVEKKAEVVEKMSSAKDAMAVIKESKPADIIEPIESEFKQIAEDKRDELVDGIENYHLVMDDISESVPEDIVEKVASVLERLERDDYRQISSEDLRGVCDGLEQISELSPSPKLSNLIELFKEITANPSDDVSISP